MVGPTPADVQSLRSAVLRLATGGRRPTLAVVSMQQGEGKTWLAHRLALSLAATGRHVAVVDANLRNADDNGAMPASSNVEVMRPSLSPDMIESTAFAADVRTIASRADVTIVDTPAYRDYPDAVPVVRLADAVLLVVREGVTRKDSLAYAETLAAREAPTPFLTVFLPNVGRL